MDADSVRRLRWTVPLGLTATLALGWAIGPALATAPRPVELPSPVFGADDGLPVDLVPGTAYTARFTVTLPADWPVDSGTDRGTYADLMMLARSSTSDSSIYCSHGYPNAAGRTVILDCPLTLPNPGPFDLYLYADDGSAFIGMLQPEGAGARVDDTVHVYHHTVTAAPSR